MFCENTSVVLNEQYLPLSSRISELETLCLLETAYNVFITTANRSIPVVIAIYRYCCVFYSTWLLSAANKKMLERIILLYMTGKEKKEETRLNIITLFQ